MNLLLPLRRYGKGEKRKRISYFLFFWGRGSYWTRCFFVVQQKLARDAGRGKYKLPLLLRIGGRKTLQIFYIEKGRGKKDSQ